MHSTPGLTAKLRLVLAREAADLSDESRHLVRSHDAPAGSATEHAARLLARAQKTLALAVAYDRRAGASWSTIGTSLGEVSKQAAHERFAPLVERCETDLLRWWLLTARPETSHREAESLDAWLTRHGDTSGPSVADVLDPMDDGEHGALLVAALTMIIKSAEDPWGRPDQRHRLELGYARRRVEWHERMIASATASPETIAEHRALLDFDRARLAELEQH